ncbi:hypothetical protein GCM10010435_28170 [Winogradskya consettensis]|uniref:Uncharacterized protein n=1 Tax=Winogradskya consettensis TaxID=113560 RepID=A0A919VPD1_9ACTN|nr:hypothetical protein [Actinoplanes consettensis]GIM71022.1 hypothetical protein Aco04nite_23340 [Actinoplanes consettensis]
MTEYDASMIQVLTLDASVRKRPGMYFRFAQDNPLLPTQVLADVLGSVDHPPTAVAPVHSADAVAEITGDLAFTVTDNLRAQPGKSGYFDSLITPDRLWFAAAAALSTAVLVEIWQDGQAYRQHLAGLHPTGPAEEFPAPPGAGARFAFTLDTTYFAPGAAITTDLATIDLHGPDCEKGHRTGSVTVRDLRGPQAPREFQYA